MKAMVLLATFLGFAVPVPQQQKKQEDFGLPELHRINSVTLSPSYSCQSRDDFHQDPGNSALFLSAYSKRRNMPELLFNGACGAKDIFQSSTAGDDMAVVADLGEITLENLTAQLSFNTRNLGSIEFYSNFAQEVNVQPNHTYAVLVNKSEIRGLFVFTVTGHVPNKKVDLRYAVKEYQIIEVKAKSPGFDWGAENN